MESIIAIRKTDSIAADKHFSVLMQKTEQLLNIYAKQYVEKYKNFSPTALEKESCKIIKEACENTPFNPQNIVLVSGHKFPDIIAEGYYGVEVKSTKQDHWISTGSSIVENTRDKHVESIYMLFGKLGGTPAEFKCRPYQDVLYDIAVTHSPRYLINMQLGNGDTIFDKLKIPYDKLRTAPDSIEIVRKYYKDVAQKKRGQMPWWISSNDADSEPISMNIRHWSSLSTEEQDNLRVQMIILFPEVAAGKYTNASMWLVSVKGVVNHCMRDNFTAGGEIKKIDEEEYSKGFPKIWGTLSIYYEKIKSLLIDYSSIYPYICEYNPSLLFNGQNNIYNNWMSQIERIIKPKQIGGKKYYIKQILEQYISTNNSFQKKQ